jgi:hypothetical protein
MKLLAAATFAAALALSSAAGAATIAGLYDTGVDNAGVATTGDAADLHWTLSGMGFGPAAFTSGVNGTWPIGPWLAEDATSRWVTPTMNAGDSLDTPKTGPDGFYDYTLTFTMPQFSAASFDGQFAADNDVVGISLNGHALTAAAPGNPLGGFDHWTGFSASTADFVAGQPNTLTFTVRNWAWDSGNATGFRAEFLDSSLTGVPEPASWALLIVGVGAAGAMLRRRHGVAATA